MFLMIGAPLIFNKFLYEIGHSKLVEMHRVLQIFIDPHPTESDGYFILATVKIAMYFLNCYIQTGAIKNIL